MVRMENSLPLVYLMAWTARMCGECLQDIQDGMNETFWDVWD